MVDIHESIETRGIFLENVGISDCLIQVEILGERTLASVDFGVSLNEQSRGIHMSRLAQILKEFKIISNETILSCLSEAREMLGAQRAEIKICTQYFRNKTTPLSKIDNKMNYEVCILASIGEKNELEIRHTIIIPITSVCPCSKAISDFGAHNQRGKVSVVLQQIDINDYNTIIDIIENYASSYGLYSILKRLDEKFVTEKAYENAKFVEDIVRDAAVQLSKIYSTQLKEIKAKNFESIHNHNAYAIYSPEVIGENFEI